MCCCQRDVFTRSANDTEAPGRGCGWCCQLDRRCQNTPSISPVALYFTDLTAELSLDSGQLVSAHSPQPSKPAGCQHTDRDVILFALYRAQLV